MKKCVWALMLALMMALCAAGALAADEPLEKTVEAQYSVESDTLKIHIDQWLYTYKKHDLRFFVAHIYTTSPEQLQTAFAGEKYSRDSAEATSAIAERHNAVLAINGDYYNYKEKNGLVIRNGVCYRDEKTTRDQLLVDKNGTFIAQMRGTHEAGSGERLVSEGIVQAFTFGPMLVENGEALELPEKYIISTDKDQREPRTAIGQAGENHYVFIVADGRRSDWSDKGMTLPELTQIFVEEGCQIAYNLDGGGSSTLILNGERLNKSSGSRERDVSDIIYIAD